MNQRYFKVPEDVLHSDLTAQQMGVLIRVLAMCNYQQSEDGSIYLTKRQLTLITGVSQTKHALKMLDDLATISYLSWTHVEPMSDIGRRYPGTMYEISCSKYPEYQGFGTPTKTKTKTNTKTKKKSAETSCPEQPSEHEIGKLVAYIDTHFPGQFVTHDSLERAAKYSWHTVYEWAESNGKLKKSWLLTVQNAIRSGWALKGWGEHNKLHNERKQTAMRFDKDGTEITYLGANWEEI